ncbi:MAG: Hsp20/alpha crystallin family protein [Melioribacteraceae bacterium]
MTLLRFEPMRELDNFQNRFQSFFGEFPELEATEQEQFLPAIDIKENEKHLMLYIEVPGIQKDDLKITLQDNILTIKGEKKKVTEEKEDNYYRSERTFGTFERSFTLPVEVDSEKVDAKVIDGILEIQLEKVQPKQPKETIITLN